MDVRTRAPSTASWIVAAGLASGVLAPHLAHACDAPPNVPRSPEQRLRELDVVARGTVTSFSSWTPWVDGGWQFQWRAGWIADLLGHDARIVIRVEEAWKGVDVDEIIVYDDGPDTCCGMHPFEAGDEVLVYAKRFEGERKLWVDGWCFPIIPIEDAQADLAYLGPGQRELRSRWWRRALAWALPALPLLLGGLWLWRRRANTATSASS